MQFERNLQLREMCPDLMPLSQEKGKVQQILQVQDHKSISEQKQIDWSRKLSSDFLYVHYRKLLYILRVIQKISIYKKQIT